MARQKQSRRGFLKGAGLMTGGVLTSSVLPAAAGAEPLQTAPRPATRPAQFRALMAKPDALIMPVANSIQMARLCEMEGFQALFIGSSGAAAHHGLPNDIPSITETYDFIAHITENTTLPVMADGEAGGFNALMTYRMTQKFEQAGAAAVMIEDAVGIETYFNRQGAPLASKQQMVDRIQAAVDARKDRNVVILARFDAPGKGVPLAQTLDAAAACAAAGADAFYFSGLPLQEQPKAWDVLKKPLMMGAGPTLTGAQAVANKVSLLFCHVENVGIGAIHQALKELKTTGKYENAAKMMLPGDVSQKLAMQSEWTARARKYNIAKS
jgi:methylisocitrate lyase